MYVNGRACPCVRWAFYHWQAGRRIPSAGLFFLSVVWSVFLSAPSTPSLTPDARDISYEGVGEVTLDCRDVKCGLKPQWSVFFFFSPTGEKVQSRMWWLDLKVTRFSYKSGSLTTYGRLHLHVRYEFFRAAQESKTRSSADDGGICLKCHLLPNLAGSVFFPYRQPQIKIPVMEIWVIKRFIWASHCGGRERLKVRLIF